jgi:hypothetical protein
LLCVQQGRRKQCKREHGRQDNAQIHLIYRKYVSTCKDSGFAKNLAGCARSRISAPCPLWRTCLIVLHPGESNETGDSGMGELTNLQIGRVVVVIDERPGSWRNPGFSCTVKPLQQIAAELKNFQGPGLNASSRLPGTPISP